jgi:predicted amidohydrolase
VEKIVAAAIQLCADVGSTRHNFDKAMELVSQAINESARLIVLPEFFTSAMALSPLMEDVARRNRELHIAERFAEMATRHSCVIAGSFLNIISGNIYNSMLVQFPDGEQFVHNKDIPTQFENRYYTDGDHTRARQGVGVALCWEMLRVQTILQMPSDVRVVAAESCWWDVPDGHANAEIRKHNHDLNRETPSQFAIKVGAPVIHASHVGSVVGLRNGVSDETVTRQLIGTTQIADHNGRAKSA